MNAPVYRIEFFGEPRPLARPRFRVIHGKGGRVFGQAYDPASNRADKYDFKLQALATKPPEPLTGALRVEMTFVRSFPASMSQKKRQTALPVTRPDLDNYEKLVLDALNRVFWRDDAQVVEVHKRKIYGPIPGIRVTVTPLEVSP